MNNRNIERKRIEQISPTISTADQIRGNELFMVSARDTNSANGYSTKKMGIQALKDYVLAGITGNNENEVIAKSNGGYEMIDTSEPGDGTYTSSTISDYISDRTKNFLWGLYVGRTGDVQSLQKTVSRDCLVVFHGDWGALEVQLNEVPLNMKCLTHNGNTGRFYIKAGQTLYVTNSSLNTYVSIIPLKSGGKFYFDTSHPERFYSGTIYQNTSINVETGRVTGNGEIFPGTEFNPNQPNAHKPTITVNWPTLFACTYSRNGNSPNVTPQPQLNDKNIWSDDIQSGDAQFTSFICLDTGDTFTPILPTNVQIDWIAYPLLVNDNSDSSQPESVQLWENGPYWATRNLGSEKPEDFGMYFPFGSTKGYYLENGRYTDRKTEFDYKFSQISEDRGTDWIEQGILEQVNENDVHVSPIHDAARTLLGEEWCIPLQSDFQGLIDNCDWEEFTINGVKGHKYTGRGEFSGKSIFLPIAGYANYPSAPDERGYYMSASLDSRYIDAADVYSRFMIYLMSGHKSNVPLENTSNTITSPMGCGLPIRPIKVGS